MPRQCNKARSKGCKGVAQVFWQPKRPDCMTQIHEKALQHCRLRTQHIVLLSVFVFESQAMTVKECSAAPLL